MQVCTEDNLNCSIPQWKRELRRERLEPLLDKLVGPLPPTNGEEYISPESYVARKRKQRGLAEMVWELEPTHILVVQYNREEYESGSGGDPMRLKKWRKGKGPGYYRTEPGTGNVRKLHMYGYARKRLKALDAIINQKLIGNRWRTSSKRIKWIAFPEISSGKIHHHLAVYVPRSLRRKFGGMKKSIEWCFQRKGAPAGTLDIQRLCTEWKQLSYLLKNAWMKESQENFMISTECASSD